MTITLSGYWGCRKGLDSLMAPGNFSTQTRVEQPVAAWQLAPRAEWNSVAVSNPLGQFIIE